MGPDETPFPAASDPIPSHPGLAFESGFVMSTAVPTSPPETPSTSPSSNASKNNPGVDLDWIREKIDHSLYTDCVHCGLCTASCPTYLETGDENDGPRGRIYLMRMIAEEKLTASPQVRNHLETCLDCRACETACPSGVQYGRIIEPFKVALHQHPPAPSASSTANRASSASKEQGRDSWLFRLILTHLFPYKDRVKLAIAPARLLQRLGGMRLLERSGIFALLPPTLRRMREMLPEPGPSTPGLPEILPPVGPRRATVALFTGCVADAMFPSTNAATARVLQHNGCEVHIPRGQGCCGAIAYHGGDEDGALERADATMTLFDPKRYDAIIFNAAGCGAMVKDYHHLVPPAERAKAEAFVAKVRDIHEFLVELGPVAPTNRLEQVVTYHDACHLRHAQGVQSQPRQLLNLIEGLDLRPLTESEVCCGAAGTYNMTQPAMAERLGRRKREHIDRTGADVVVTGNVGCIMQIAHQVKGLDRPIRVLHPIDLLDEAYGPVPTSSTV